MIDRFKFRFWDKDCKKYVSNERQRLNGLSLYINNPRSFITEQCTGLKDKNGKLIYEGDIVELDDCGLYSVIEWDDETGYWKINTIENTIYTFDNLYGYELTIVGNIHENTELMI